MKYSEIVGIQEYFESFYNIENETGSYWKRFIPNTRFYDLLREVLSCVETNDTGLRKSFWIQGTFGTGKSHAAGVVKHLLWEEWDDISEYVEDQITDTLVKSKLINFRKKKKLLPIVIKGIQNITDHRAFALEIEKAVKNTLRKLNANISVKSDFEKLIEKAENGIMPCDMLIEDEELGLYVNSKQEIIEMLKAENTKFMRMLESALSRLETFYSQSDITQWLKEINHEIVKEGIADGIIIYWDEFTTVMDFASHNQNADSVGAAIINIIQSIAELSVKDNIYLYLISHRKAEHYDRANSREDIQKMRDRFCNITYEIEPITTFHIISAAIKKIDKNIWSQEKDNTFNTYPQLNELVTQLTNNHSSATKEVVKNLYPIHPYSAYLSTFIARNMGSANRSIFEFLNNDEGFKKFLNEDVALGIQLTADYLWDYFAESFEQDPKGDFRQIIDKYRLHADNLKNKGESYLKVFKSILLLNVLYKKIDVSAITTSYVAPSIINISSLFIGLSFENEIPVILSYIDENEIIPKTPSDYFLIEFSSLPFHEVEKEKTALKSTYINDVVKILADTKLKGELETRIFKDNIYRSNEVVFISSSINLNEHILRNKLTSQSTFHKPYTLRIAFFLSRTIEDKDKTISLIEKLSNEPELSDIIFVSSDEVMGENSFERFVDFIARKQVSDNHRYEEQAMNYQNYAVEHVEKWVNLIKERNLTIYFRGNENKVLAEEAGMQINKKYACEIFSKGIDCLSLHKNVWKEQRATSSIEKVMFSDDRTDLQSKLNKGVDMYLLPVFQNSQKEFIINDSLEIKNNIDVEHPLILIQNFVDDILDKQRKKAQFNLGKELEELKMQPFGLYKNMPNMALLGLVFRKYINDDLQTADAGRQIGKEAMRDIVANLFDYWEGKATQNKLQLRFGSKEERKLKLKLIQLFNLNNVDSIIDSRFAIRRYIHETAMYPLWSIRYYSQNEDVLTTIVEMQNLMSSFAKDLDNNLIKKTLDAVETFGYELRDELKPENFRTGFINFLYQIPKVQITDFDITSILSYLKSNLGGEIWTWEEDKVQDKVRLWYYEVKNVPTTTVSEPDKPTTTNPTGTDKTSMPTGTNGKTIIENIQNSTYGEQELKRRIIRILENHPELQSIFQQYFS